MRPTVRLHLMRIDPHFSPVPCAGTLIPALRLLYMIDNMEKYESYRFSAKSDLDAPSSNRMRIHSNCCASPRCSVGKCSAKPWYPFSSREAGTHAVATELTQALGNRELQDTSLAGRGRSSPEYRTDTSRGRSGRRPRSRQSTISPLMPSRSSRLLRSAMSENRRSGVRRWPEARG